MRKLLLLVLALLATVMLQAQTTTTTTTSRPKVGLVLGGGGAKGASHIGVLKYIEELGIPVDYVAGTSMGSIMGGLYAMGYEPDEMTRLISNINWSQYIGNSIDRRLLSEEARDRNSTTVINIPIGKGDRRYQDSRQTLMNQLPSAYVNNSSLINLFNDLCVGYQDEMNFDDMPIPFACVATDLITGDEVVMRSGHVSSAIRASMAIPGVFAPVVMGDYVLVDGGLVNNFPADVLKDMGADIIIGVEVTNENSISAADLQSLPQVLGRLVVNGTSAKRKENRQMCDVRIVPDISGFGMLSFTPEAIDTLVGRGYKEAVKYHDQLMAIKERIDASAGEPVTKTLHAPRARNLQDGPVLVQSIDIEGITDQEHRWLMRKSGLKEGQVYSADDIERAVSIFRGTNCFDEVTYTVTQINTLNDGPDGYALNFNVKPAKANVIGLGLRYDTWEGASLLFNAGLGEKRFGGPKLNLSARLSSNPRFKVGLGYSLPSVATFNLNYTYKNEHFRVRTFDEGTANMHCLQQQVSASITQFHLLNFETSIGVTYTATQFDRSSAEEATWLDTLVFAKNQMLAPFVSLKFDNRDDAYFARRGIYARATGRYYYNFQETDDNYFDLCYSFQSYITPANGRFTIIPQLYGHHQTGGTGLFFNNWILIGGEIENRHFEEQLPFVGLNLLDYWGSSASVVRCDFRYNFYGNHYLTAMYNMGFEWFFVTNALDGGAFYCSNGAGLKYTYRSLLGPISLTGHWSDITKKFGGYFSIGFNF